MRLTLRWWHRMGCMRRWKACCEMVGVKKVTREPSGSRAGPFCAAGQGHPLAWQVCKHGKTCKRLIGLC